MLQNIISTPLKARFNLSNVQNTIKSIQLTHNLRELTLHITSALGFIAIAILLLMFINPNLTNKFNQLSPFGKEVIVQNIEEVDAVIEAPNLALLMATPQLIANSNEADSNFNAINNADFIGTSKQQKLVTNWLARRYRVANDAVNMLVSASYLSAKETKLDPLLILSVIAIESRFNPFSESPVGAQGLMQVMSKVHVDKFSEHGGTKAALNPVANIQVGSLILKDYVKRSGSVEGGLKRYVGAADMDTDGGYGALVLAEYKRLKDVASGKQVSIYATTPRSVEPAQAPAPLQTQAQAQAQAQVQVPVQAQVQTPIQTSAQMQLQKPQASVININNTSTSNNSNLAKTSGVVATATSPTMATTVSSTTPVATNIPASGIVSGKAQTLNIMNPITLASPKAKSAHDIAM